jgi:hypothetical protein
MNDLPEDLAHPRGMHASFIANLVVGFALLVILAGTIAFGLMVSR